MKRILKVFLAAVFSVSLAGVSVAGDFSMDPSTIGSTQTEVDNIFGFTFIGTSNIQYTSGTGLGATDPFIDNGALLATTLLSAPSVPFFTGGLNGTWELGAIFDGLAGANTSVDANNVSFAFTPGVGVIQIYASPTTGTFLPNDPSSIAGGILVAELTLVSGVGNFDFDAADGNVDLIAEFTNLPMAGFWDYLGVDIDLGTQIFLALTDSNNNTFTADAATIAAFNAFFGGTSGNNPPTNFFVSNDGSVQLQQASIPEPASMILLGFGLLGTVAFARRRSRKAK